MNVSRMLLCVAVLAATGCGGPVTIDVPKAALQSTVEGYFPLESKDFGDAELPVSATLSDPKVVLDEDGDRMGLEVRVVAVRKAPPVPAAENAPPATVPEVAPAAPEAAPALPFAEPDSPPSRGPKLLPPGSPVPDSPVPGPSGGVDGPPGTSDQSEPPREFEGTLIVFGDLSYEPESGAFFYRNPSVQVESLEPVPEAIRGSVKQVAEGMLSKYLDENPVYTLSDEQATGKAAKLLLKSVRVEDGSLRMEVGP